MRSAPFALVSHDRPARLGVGLAVQAVNYAAFSLFITLYIVFLFRSGGFSQTSAAHIRLFNTALGGCIALLIDAASRLLSRSPLNATSSAPSPAIDTLTNCPDPGA